MKKANGNAKKVGAFNDKPNEIVVKDEDLLFKGDTFHVDGVSDSGSSSSTSSNSSNDIEVGGEK